MNILRHRAWLSLLALLIVITPLTVLAQDGEPIRIDGSRIVSLVVGPLAEAYSEDTDADVSVEVSGTSSGLSRLCSGEIDMAAAARAITDAEAAACADNNVEWVEVVVAYDVAAVIANPTFTFADCLTLGELSTLVGPGATDTVNDWSLVRSSWSANTFELYGPPSDSTALNLLDELLPGDGLRTDFVTQESAADVVSMVVDDVAGAGIAPWNAVSDSEAEVTTFAIDDLSGNGCIAPTTETIENSTYPAARGLYLYVNAASLEREDVTGLLDSLFAEGSQAVVTENGFVAPSEDVAAAVQTNVSERVTGRQFSQGEPLYTIPLDISGSVVAEAAAGAYQVLDNVDDAFTGAYSGVTVNLTAFGNVAAYRELCSGEVDLGSVTRLPTDDEAALCEESGVELWEVPLGHQAVVILAPAAADYAACLTTDQLAALWQNQGEATITNWSQLGEGFPDQELSIFLPLEGSSFTDFILFQSSAELLDPRMDAVETDNDELYRAAATANVPGALTYVSFDAYQQTDADVIAVSIDAGDGCVAPSIETIRDGSYVLTRPFYLQISMDALARPEVQSLVWYLLRDASREFMQDGGAILFDEDTFAAYQEQSVELFADAEAMAAAAAEADAEAEATPAEDGAASDGTDAESDTGADAGAEATPEATTSDAGEG
ncbi:MAG: substrate-binding domain-containing protein [Anaerolineae bacterium]|nr:substrate-binding domain-containing protein [Anaerolineae bacterium]